MVLIERIKIRSDVVQARGPGSIIDALDLLHQSIPPLSQDSAPRFSPKIEHAHPRPPNKFAKVKRSPRFQELISSISAYRMRQLCVHQVRD
jgi:hypothetical protein